jgi:hypothetical protein
MRAFIVRPFHTRNGIPFDEVEERLIAPALKRLGIEGHTTEYFLQAGNIRKDMFQQLLVADIVIADISIHNANVFYELGIRHALQPRRTFLLRARVEKPQAERDPEDEVPFDIRTDRFLEYDAANPAKIVDTLEEALRQTLANDGVDSPVFETLPDLQPPDRSSFLTPPPKYVTEVEYAAKKRETGKLGLLATEALAFPWASEGLRIAARAQSELKLYRAAKDSWEALYNLDPADTEANLQLGIINLHLGDLDASDQALQRVLKDDRAHYGARSQALLHLAGNIRERWRLSWCSLPAGERPAKALESPYLLKAFAKYREAFTEDLSNYMAGSYALSLLTITTHLATANLELWRDRFDQEAEADLKLADLERERQDLTVAVRLALAAAKDRVARTRREDRSLEMFLAHLEFLTNTKPPKVNFAYQSALTEAADFVVESAAALLNVFDQVGVLRENIPKALAEMSAARPEQPPDRVVVFSGHTIDMPGRTPPRLPSQLVDKAALEIRTRLEHLKNITSGGIVAIGSAASGGDILFHEICKELRIPARLLLPVPPDVFRNESVSPSGQEWEDRFDRLLKDVGAFACLATSNVLPIWLSVRKDYSTWQRTNFWLIHEALSLSARSITLLALWDGDTEPTNATYHMRTAAEHYGAALVTIYTLELLKADPNSIATA